tara:strand:+ start:788 stop:1204 length:417 start_codon:yes stop_codon:yes gene_type:complete
MVDAIGLYAGIKPEKGAKEFTYADYSPSMNMFSGIKLNNVRNPTPGYFDPIGKLPTEFNDTIFRSTLKQVLPVKGQPEAVRYGRPELEKNDWQYVNQGFARHQEKGLASDANKPMDLPIMPIAGFYNPDLVNTFGNLK